MLQKPGGGVVWRPVGNLQQSLPQLSLARPTLDGQLDVILGDALVIFARPLPNSGVRVVWLQIQKHIMTTTKIMVLLLLLLLLMMITIEL